MGKENIKKENNIERYGKTMVKGVAIMSIAGIISKFLGAMFRIPLANWIGAKGMSYYSAAYSIYSFFLFISMAGLPVAISRMISERNAIGDEKNVNRVFKVSLALMISLGTISAFILIISAKSISIKIANQGAYLSMIALTPVLLFAPIDASLRGYFQGKQDMFPTALSEVVEQFFRVTVGLFLAYFFLNKSLVKASAGATFGASAGSFSAMLLMTFIYFRYKKNENNKIDILKRDIINNEKCEKTKEKESIKSILKELIYISVPITIGSSILPIVFMIDAVMIMPRLHATGWLNGEAKVLYGLLGGYCYPITEFPQVFTIAVAVSMVPAVAESIKKKDKTGLESNVKLGIKSLMLISFPCMVGLLFLARPILNLLYPARPEEISMAVPVLEILAFGMISFSLLRAFSSILQGAGKQTIPVRNLAIGALTKVVITFILVGIPAINVKGAAVGNVVAFTTSAILNYLSVKRYVKVKLDFNEIILKPLLISLVMGVITLGIYKLLGVIIGIDQICTIISILSAVIIYFVLVFISEYITKEDTDFMPYGDKIYALAKKMRIAR